MELRGQRENRVSYCSCLRTTSICFRVSSAVPELSITKSASKSRIKRLRGLRRPQYRLRIEDVRVFYDVVDRRVEILAIVLKSKANEWLDEKGEKS